MFVRMTQACMKKACMERMQFSHQPWISIFIIRLQLNVSVLDRTSNYALIDQLAKEFIATSDEPLAEVWSFSPSTSYGGER